MQLLIIWILVGFFGACVGSFLNVVIYRLPQKKSVVTPRSFCRQCKTPIAWYDNIPIISFLILMGKCRDCKKRIDLQYPLVELAATGLALASFNHFHQNVAHFLAYYIFLIAPLLCLLFIDLKHQIIPNIISLPGIITGFLISIIIAPQTQLGTSWKESLLGILVGGGFLFLIGYLYEKIRKQEGLGGGDVKLTAMFGAFFGWQAVFFILLIASLSGSLFGVAAMIFRQKKWRSAIPFGPFLVFAAYLYLFFGKSLLTWYFQMLPFS